MAGWMRKSMHLLPEKPGWHWFRTLMKRIRSEKSVSEPIKKNDLQYYYDRPRRTGDYHGQGPVLWCTVALLEK
mgnify:CR=1 FL=1